MLLVALALSAIAAFYSIAGLAAIFAAAVTPIVIMGSILEISKLVLASWLYRNWFELPKLMKSYFLTAVIILMTLTSLGIFGFLSKAHLNQAVPTGDVQAKVSLIEEKINQEKEIINESRATLAQLDKQVNEIINRTASATDTKAVERSISARKRQATERKQLYEAISAAQAEVSKLQQEKAPLAAQVRKIEAEVGPIKYVAQLIYGDQVDQTLLEKAVRIVILMIVSVFDPLAVLMLVGYNWTLKNARKENEPDMSYYSDSHPIEETIEDKVLDEYFEMMHDIKEKHYAGGDDEPEVARTPQEVLDDGREVMKQMKARKPRKKSEKKFFEEGKELAKAIDKNNGNWDPSFSKALDPEVLKLFEGDDVVPTPPSPTIEQEIEELQKPIEYDSAGRRITP